MDFLLNTADGLLAGAAYALLAVGFALVFGIFGRLNLAFGATIMAGVYAGAFAHAHFGAGPVGAGLAVLAVSVLVGLYVERLCFAPFAAGAGVTAMVSSFAVWMQIEEAAMLALPDHTQPFPALWGDASMVIGGEAVRLDRLMPGIAAAVVVAGLWALLYRARFGLVLRAVAEEPAAARIIGAPVERLSSAIFALASAVGGLAGFLIAAADQQATPMLGMWAMTKGLTATMLGGLGSLPGAVAGGLVLGVLEAHLQWHLGPQARDLIVYLVLFAAIALRPQGLFGWGRPANDDGGARPGRG